MSQVVWVEIKFMVGARRDRRLACKPLIGIKNPKDGPLSQARVPPTFRRLAEGNLVGRQKR